MEKQQENEATDTSVKQQQRASLCTSLHKDLKTKVEELAASKQEDEAQLARWVEVITELEGKAEQQRQDILRQHMENERLSLEIQQEAEWQAELNQIADDMEMEIAELEKLFSGISVSIVEADRQRQIADDAMKKDTEHLDILERKLVDMKRQNEAYRRTREEDLKRMEDQAEEMNRKFLEEKLILENRLEELSQQEEKVKWESREVDADIAEQSKRNQELRMGNVLLKSEVAALQEQFAISQAKAENLKLRIQEVKMSQENHGKQLEELREKSAEIQKELEDAKHRHSARVSALNIDIEEKNSILQKFRDKETHLQEMIANKIAELERARNRKTEANAKLMQLNEDHAAMDTCLARKRSQLQGLDQQLSQKDDQFTEMEHLKESKIGQLDEMSKQAQQLQTEVDQLQQVHASEQRRLEVTEEEVRTMNESIQSKLDIREQKRKELDELNAKIDRKKAEKEDYQRRIDEIREMRAKAAEDAKAVAEAELDRLKEKFDETSREYGEWTKKINEKRRILAEIRARKEQYDNQAADLAQKIAEKEAALELKKQLFHADEVAMEIEEKQLMDTNDSLNRQTLERLTTVRAELAEMQRMREQTIEMRAKTDLLQQKIEERGLEYEYQRKRSADSFLEIEACRRQLDELIRQIENPPEFIDEYDLSQENDEHLPPAEPMENDDDDDVVVVQDDDAADSTVTVGTATDNPPSNSRRDHISPAKDSLPVTVTANTSNRKRRNSMDNLGHRPSSSMDRDSTAIADCGKRSMLSQQRNRTRDRSADSAMKSSKLQTVVVSKSKENATPSAKIHTRVIVSPPQASRLRGKSLAVQPKAAFTKKPGITSRSKCTDGPLSTEDADPWSFLN